MRTIFFNLLFEQKEFSCFFSYVGYANPLSALDLESLIWLTFENKICQAANHSRLITTSPVPLAYCLSLINVSDRYSITPAWVLHTFPAVDRLMFLLRNNPCVTGCSFCDEALDSIKALNRYFGHPSFRSYDGKPLQENAVRAAVNNKSLLAVFPTGGGKSITFQIPVLMSGDNAKALTVVISPLQSLMKDRVDNLEKKGITSAVTINGMLDPVEKQNAIKLVSWSITKKPYFKRSKTATAMIVHLLRSTEYNNVEFEAVMRFLSTFEVTLCFVSNEPLQEKEDIEHPIREVDRLEFYHQKRISVHYDRVELRIP